MVSDTPVDVANEMVRELDITYRDPSQIADMIAREVSALVPDWKDPKTEERDPLRHVYGDEEDSHSFPEPSSSTSTQESVTCILPSQSPWPKGNSQNKFWTVGSSGKRTEAFWSTLAGYGDEEERAEDDSSRGSTCCSMYSFENWMSSMEQEMSPHARTATRFRPEDIHRIDRCVGKKHDLWPERRQLQKNRSLVDIRSQILHRALVEEVNKRIFNTVGSVEGIGFQNPEETSRRSSSRVSGKKSQGSTWGRG